MSGYCGKRQEAGGGRIPITLNNHRAVMQRSGGLEDGAKQIARNDRRSRFARFRERT